MVVPSKTELLVIVHFETIIFRVSSVSKGENIYVNVVSLEYFGEKKLSHFIVDLKRYIGKSKQRRDMLSKFIGKKKL